MDKSFEEEEIITDNCVWIKEESELETEENIDSPILQESNDPLCELSSGSSQTAENESELEADENIDSPILHESNDSCEISSRFSQFEENTSVNEEAMIDEIVEDILRKDHLALPLQPIVDLQSNDDDPELKLDEITANVEMSEEVSNSAERVIDMPYQCSECYFTCFQHANYLKHLRIHIAEKTHTCPTCSKSFVFRNSFLKHLKIHQHEKIYEAMKTELEDCENVATDKEQPGEFSCAACNFTCTTRLTLLRHIKRDSMVEPYECLICKQKFEQKLQLMRHEKTHEVEMPFTCNVCEVRFADKYGLAQHAITHTYEKSFLCTLCNRRFWLADRLEEHMETFHDSNKRFECKICHYKFKRSQDVGRHMRIHEPVSTFECPLCTHTTKTHRMLARHAKGHLAQRSNKRQYQCPLCRRKLIGNHKVISHLENHAKEKW